MPDGGIYKHSNHYVSFIANVCLKVQVVEQFQYQPKLTG